MSVDRPGYVEVPEFTPNEEIDTDDIGELQNRIKQLQAAQGVRSAKVNQTVQSHEVDTGDDQVHGNVDVVEQEQDLMNWRDPGNLEMPAARPGFVQRLVRTAFRVGQDPQNWSRAMREGWQPRPMSSVPKEDLPPTITHATLGSVIGVEGLILCEMPVRIARQRAKFYRNQTAVQTEAIERDIHKEERQGYGAIIADRRSRVKTGRGADSED